MPNITIQADDGSGSFSAYLLEPISKPAGVVVLIQEVFGVNQAMRDIAAWVADLGFIAVCPDLFWRIEPGIDITDKSEAEWKKAFELFNSFDQAKGIEDLKATVAAARKLPGANGRVATMGYCLGGRLAFMMAEQSDTDANISYYGVGLDNLLGDLAKVSKPLIVHIADKDEFFPPEGRAKVVEAVKGHRQIAAYVYPNADHAFARVGGVHWDGRSAAIANGRSAEALVAALSVKFARWLLAAGALLAAMPAHAWDDYQIIQWQSRNEPAYAALKRLGVTAAMVMANRDGTGIPAEKQFAPMRAAGLSWYVENAATDFYSAYHRWFPNREVNWRFVEAQQRFQQSPDDETVFWRDPSFADPAWQQRIHDRLIATVHEQSRYRPLYYSLGDETGIADLTAFFDFDLSPGSLAGMRDWLREGYGSLDALNAEWGTAFARWEDVRPETTRQAMRRADDNFAAWADFKAWMDVAFARALRMGTDAVHEADPSALAAIEGVQIPGWGGYDYSLLVDAVDVMEVHDLPLAQALNPRLVTLTTSFGARPQDIHAIWRDLLAGSRGLILWDSEKAIVRDDASAGEQGLAYAETFAEIRGGIGALLIASEQHIDPIAILYSSASFRTQWMLEQKPKGDAWMIRKSETELESNAARDAMWAYRHAITHLGLQPACVSSPADLTRRGIRTLILPHAIALSPDDVRAIREFAAGGGTVIADIQPGVFDAHSRRQPRPLLDAGMLRMIATSELTASSLGVTPGVRIEAPNGDVTGRIWRHGNDTIVAVQRDFASDAANETVVLTLPKVADVYDLRNKQTLGRTDRITLTLDAISPALVSITLP